MSKLSLALPLSLGLNPGMNKGCLIAAGIFAVLAVLCCGGGYFVFNQYAGPIMLAQMEADIASYRKAHPDATVEPSNEAWSAILADPANGAKGQAQWQQLVTAGKGKLIDLHRNPVRIEPQPDGTIFVISNGKDGLPNTADDETAEKARSMIPQS